MQKNVPNKRTLITLFLDISSEKKEIDELLEIYGGLEEMMRNVLSTLSEIDSSYSTISAKTKSVVERESWKIIRIYNSYLTQ